MMNKLLVIFSLFLIVSMGFVTIPNIIHADSQLDILEIGRASCRERV